MAFTSVSAIRLSRRSRAEKTMKNGTAVATGGSTRWLKNQTVRSLFLIRKKRKRASA